MPRTVTHPPVRMQLVSPGLVTLFQDVSDEMDPNGVISIVARVVVIEKEGNFQASVSIQTFDTDIEVGNNPVVPSSGGTNLGMKQAVGKYMQTFDPTHALNGNIVGKYRFRIGVSYSTHTAAAITRGEVLIEFSVKYA